MKDPIPRWSLEQIYPGPGSVEFASDLDVLKETIVAADRILEESEPEDPVAWLREILPVYDRCTDLFENLESFAYASYSVNTGDTAAQEALSAVGVLSVPLSGMAVRFRSAVAALPGTVAELLAGAEDLSGYHSILEEARLFQQRQLSPAEESLAADLARSGADAWSRLHETVSSTLQATWDPESGETKSAVELRALAYDADRDRRKRAWQLELESWQRVETPLAFALNGVKGTTATLNTRRGWHSTLERSTRQNRLSDTILTTMIAEMRRALPLFRRYLLAKAEYLEIPRLSFYDLFAPVGDGGPPWTFDAAMTYIESKLGEFDNGLGTFVRTAREKRWIDAEPRSAKVGGAYSIDFPLARESRILANYDGSYDSVSTLAHELGHAWHSHLMFDLPASQRQYPMTLAETASIFNETLLFYRTLEDTKTPPRRLFILEQFLQSATQIVVDILSRFEFESMVMERRAERELPAAELCEAMVTAQKAAYGDALNPEELHPYMWAVKGHYYRADLAFYNFPYAFGELFGLGLYSQFEEDSDQFRLRYRGLLRETGRQQAAAVAAGVGFDIESPAFWRGAVDRIEGIVREFETTVQSAASR